MKRILLLSFIAMMFTSANAQLFKIWGINVGYVYVGPKLGFNMSTTSADVLSGQEKTTNFGYQFGGVAKFGITKKLSIQPELAITNRGSAYKDDVIKSSSNYNYIGIPVVAKYAFSSFLGVDIYGSGGFYTDVMTGGSFKTVIIDEEHPSAEWIEQELDYYNHKIEGTAWEAYNRVDFGFNFGVGAIIPIKDKDELTVDFRYAQGVVDIEKTTSSSSSKSTSFQLTALYLVDLTKWVNFRGENKDKDAYEKSSKKSDTKEQNAKPAGGTKIEER